MIYRDEASLICDYVEFYHVFDYRSLSVQMAATLFMGLRSDSRSKMLLSGMKYTLLQMITVMIYDKLAWLQWSRTEKGAKNIDIPEPLSKMFFDIESSDSNDIQAFNSKEEYERERERLLGGES